MEDFEYSVEICDRDWECFFAECEACNLLPPSLAHVDESGMSDMDDTGSILAKRAQKVDLTAGFSEADGPPDCEGSPVEHYLSKHSVGGMESVLSGSEEDIHLQSVNMFFETCLKNVTEVERPVESCQVRAGKNREAVVEEAHCRDGQQSSSSTLPENIPKLNFQPARGEAAVGKETVRPVDTISNINTTKKVEHGSNISCDPSASNSVLKTNKSAYPETELLIREEACTETRINEVTQWNQFHYLTGGGVYSVTTPHTDNLTKMQTCTSLKDVGQKRFLTSQLTFSDKCNVSSPSNVEMVRNAKWKEDQTALFQSDTMCINKPASQESPSASIKRKRRKKRRLSFEPPESAHGYERRLLVQPSDSEEEQYAGRAGTALCLSENVNLLYSSEPQTNAVSSLYSVTSNPPMRLSAQTKADDLFHAVPTLDSQYQYVPENILRQGRYKATSLAEHKVTNSKSVTSLSRSDGNVISATNNSGNNVLTNLQPCIKVEELTRQNKHSLLPVSVSGSVTGESGIDRKTANSKREDAADSIQDSGLTISGCENQQNLTCYTAEVKSITPSILPSAESNDPTVGASQNDNLSDTKSVLAVEAGNSIRDNRTLCQREAEPQQQLEIDCHDTDKFRSTLDKIHSLNTKPQQFKTRACPISIEISNNVTCAELATNCINSSPHENCLDKSTSSLDINDTKHQTECHLEVQTLSKLAKLAATQLMASNNTCISGEINLTGSSRREIKMSSSTDLTSTSDITSCSSCSTLHKESIMSLSHENTTDLSDTITASKDEHEPKKAPDSKHSVFAMSSFWSEMEKLTINDILGVRMISKAAPPISLPPLQEIQQTNIFATTDSSFFAQLDESKPKQTNISRVHESLESGSFTAVDSSPSRSVMWQSEPVPVSLDTDLYPEHKMLTSMSDISQPVLPGSAQKSLRKISKTVSAHNLHALGSLRSTWKGQTLQTLDKGKSEMPDYFSEEQMSKQAKEMDSLPSSFTAGYKISVTNIFQYLFGGKQSISTQSATDNVNAFYTDGNSVPETYDHFFSEFDTENLFCPLITAEDQAKDERVPIFSYSRSANRNLQFPEVYDCLFISSSSDDSSESDEEDNCSPMKVVTRFSHKPSTSQLSADNYENFFTDSDLTQNFFWKTTLSFRNMKFSGFSGQRQTLSDSLSHAPVRQSGRSLRRTVYPSNVLGNQDVMFADPLLYQLEDRISRQQAQQPFTYEDLQIAISNPRLETSFLPLQQSDMCLVCIAFASWVLKTANPQIGDAWKAVLLANVSALSAIRYLRKYVTTKAATVTRDDKRLHHTAPSESRSLCL